MNNATYFLISTVFDLYLMVVLLRLWLQMARADFYNPFSQFVVKATHPIVAPLRRILPAMGPVDTATLLLALLVSFAKILVIQLVFANGIPPIVTILFQSIGNLLIESLQLIFWVLLLSAILSWVSQGRSPIEYVMRQLTDPLLAPIRKVIPAIGGLDLSVLVAIIAIQFIQLLVTDLFRF